MSRSFSSGVFCEQIKPLQVMSWDIPLPVSEKQGSYGLVIIIRQKDINIHNTIVNMAKGLFT